MLVVLGERPSRPAAMQRPASRTDWSLERSGFSHTSAAAVSAHNYMHFKRSEGLFRYSFPQWDTMVSGYTMFVCPDKGSSPKNKKKTEKKNATMPDPGS